MHFEESTSNYIQLLKIAFAIGKLRMKLETNDSRRKGIKENIVRVDSQYNEKLQSSLHASNELENTSLMAILFQRITSSFYRNVFLLLVGF